MGKPVIIILGPTGSGKSLQAKKLAAHLGYVRLSTGALLREAETPETDRYLDQGKLALSEDVQQVLADAIERLGEYTGLVLDGFPRLMPEAEWFEDYARKQGLNLEKVIVFTIGREVSAQRVLGRGREDDSRLTFDNKWDDYERRTMPVIAYYTQRNLVVEIDGSGEVENIFQKVKERIEEQD